MSPLLQPYPYVQIIPPQPFFPMLPYPYLPLMHMIPPPAQSILPLMWPFRRVGCGRGGVDGGYPGESGGYPGIGGGYPGIGYDDSGMGGDYTRVGVDYAGGGGAYPGDGGDFSGVEVGYGRCLQ